MPAKPSARAGTRRHANAATQQPEGIRLLLAGLSTPDVAEKLGVGVRTVKKWKGSEAYSDAVAEKTAIVGAAMNGDAVSIGAAAADAVTVLGRRLRILAKEEEPTCDDATEAGVHFRTLAAGLALAQVRPPTGNTVNDNQPLEDVLRQLVEAAS